MTAGPRLAAVFADPRSAAAAIRALRAARCEVRAAMAVPAPEVLAAIGGPPSRLGRAALAGAVAGAAGGAALTAGSSLAWPLVTGGKPIVSVPPFAVICFELAVLAAALATVAALLCGARRDPLARLLPPPEALAGGRIAVVARGDVQAAAGIALAHGAVEVRRVA